MRSSLLLGKEVVSIYFGGGTPSLLSPHSIEKILSFISKEALISPSCEITLEANPESTTLLQMQLLSSLGINRISIGVQSFDDHLLKQLGRTHDSNASKKALDSIYKGGISNISIDLMYELPGQTLSSWENSLNELKNLPITHLSLYNLVFEPGTSFHLRKKQLSPSLPSEETSLLMLNQAVEALKQIDLLRYEISAFAKKGFESVHNTGYWTARPFLGLGPSAFSYWEGRRFKNIAHLKKYESLLNEEKFPEDFEEKLSSEESQKELLAVELRLLQGVNLDRFQAKTKPLCSSLEKSIKLLLEKNWLQKKQGTLSLTEEGLLFYDSVAAELI